MTFELYFKRKIDKELPISHTVSFYFLNSLCRRVTWNRLHLVEIEILWFTDHYRQ